MTLLIEILALLIAFFIINRYGIGERYGAYIVRKRGNVWTVHHNPSFILFYANLNMFLKIRKKSFRRIAATLPKDAYLKEESIWLDGLRNGASSVDRRTATLSEWLLGKQLMWQNIYNWNPFKRKRKRERIVITSTWTAQEFIAEFEPINNNRLLHIDDRGMAGALMYFILFTHGLGLTLMLFGQQIASNNGFYDILYTSSDAATLAGAYQQQTTVIQSQNGFPSLWTQILNDSNAIVQTERLFRENLYTGFPSSFVDNHLYIGNNTQPGYSDNALLSYVSFPSYTYNGQPYERGIQIDLPISFDTTLTNAVMQLLQHQTWSNRIQFTIHSRSTFPFLLYDSAHQNGYKP